MVTKKRVEAMKSETEANAQGTKGHGKETRTHIDRFGLKQETNILLAQPELTENRTARGTDTKEIENKHSSRLVGGVETDTGVERTRVAVAGPRLAECGTNGAGSPSTSRPCDPTFAQINPEGRTNSGGEWGRQSGR